LAVISYANACIIATLFIVFSGADYYGKKSIPLDYDRQKIKNKSSLIYMFESKSTLHNIKLSFT